MDVLNEDSYSFIASGFPTDIVPCHAHDAMINLQDDTCSILCQMEFDLWGMTFGRKTFRCFINYRESGIVNLVRGECL